MARQQQPDASTSAPAFTLLRCLGPKAHSQAVSSVKFSPRTGTLIATASADKTVKIWRSDTGELVQTLEGHEQGISDVAWAMAENYLCTASDDHTLKLWDAASGKCLRTLKGHTNFVFCCCFSPQGHLVVRWCATLAHASICVVLGCCILVWNAFFRNAARACKHKVGRSTLKSRRLGMVLTVPCNI